MSNKNITYIVLCGRGILKNECPIIAQGGCCVECNFARYMQRQPTEKNKDQENKTINEDV